MAPSRGVRPRAMRIPPELWAEAVAKAGREGTTVTAVVVAALRTFIARPARQSKPDTEETP